MNEYEILRGDTLKWLRRLPDELVQCIVTSPPYWGLRDYGIDGQIGLEKTPEEYVAKLVEVFREVRRVLRSDGTLWLNLGDSYAGGAGSSKRRRKDASGVTRPCVTQHCERCGKEFEGTAKRRFCSAYCGGVDNSKRSERPPYGLKPKDLVGIPWRVALALQADGWWLRSDIIWHKPNPMPESVTDRPTKSHEYVFMLTKSVKYFWDQEAVRERHVTGEWWDRPVYNVKGNTDRGDNGQPPHSANPAGRNIRSVWTIATVPFPSTHFATFPPEIPERCIKAGSREGDVILDPFCGASTTGLVAMQLGRGFIGIDINPEYCDMGELRIEKYMTRQVKLPDIRRVIRKLGIPLVKGDN